MKKKRVTMSTSSAVPASLVRRRIARIPLGLLIPFAVVFVLFFLGPFLYALWLSFFVESGDKSVFVGLQNYVVAWQDTEFWTSFLRVAWYGVTAVVVMLVFGLGLSLLLDSPFARTKTLFRLVYFLPYAVPGVIAALMWGFLYSPQLNHLIGALSAFNGGHAVNLLSSGTLLYAIVNMAAWGGTGYTMTIYFASLTSIPVELYEAARLDGASEWQIARMIKIPMIRSTILMTVVLSLIGSLQLFNEPYVLKSITDVPWNYTPNLEIFNMAFTYGNFTYSATLSILLAVTTFILSLLFMLVTSETRTRRSKAPVVEAAAARPTTDHQGARPIQIGVDA
ncbi:MAG: sugar transporter permease [Microbacteriaceae bacterium]|jgi:multiple sugar transport system permease protein|nr:sugar transporter permease [Microbacteriaceae bacterium]